MSLTITDVVVAVGRSQVPGHLVFEADRLLAVLTRIDAQEGMRSGWYVEAAFGPLIYSPVLPVFATVAEALDWMQARLNEPTI